MKGFPSEARQATNPLFNSNKLKLGVFGINGPGTVMTLHPDRFVPTWDASLRVAEAVDRAGLEAIVPYSRWKSFGDAHHGTGVTLDTFAWAAAVSARTEYSSIFATVHAHAVHPLVAAKQSATIDQISGGRFALNLVVGFYSPEIETFGIPAGDHDQRYSLGEEWIAAVKRLWTEDEFVTLEGTHVTVREGMSQPKPVQRPTPPIMNAGSSERGRRLAAEHADIAFIVSPNPDYAKIAEQVRSYKQFARDEYDRDIMVWGYALVQQGDDDADARARVEEYTVGNPDDVSIDMFLKYQVKNVEQMPAETLAQVRRMMAMGGGVPLIGTAATVADGLSALSETGLDGVLLTFVDYEAGVDRFNAEVLPLLEARGLRERHVAARRD